MDRDWPASPAASFVRGSTSRIPSSATEGLSVAAWGGSLTSETSIVTVAVGDSRPPPSRTRKSRSRAVPVGVRPVGQEGGVPVSDPWAGCAVTPYVSGCPSGSLPVRITGTATSSAVEASPTLATGALFGRRRRGGRRPRPPPSGRGACTSPSASARTRGPRAAGDRRAGVRVGRAGHARRAAATSAPVGSRNRGRG